MFLVFIINTILIRHVAAQLGFVCRGYVEFSYSSISENDKKELYFYSKAQTDSLIECARLCYRKEFCRAAVYDTVTNTCQYSYFKGSCSSDTVRTRTASPSVDGFIRITCIRCEKGHRAEDPVTRAIDVSNQATVSQSGVRSLTTDSFPVTKPLVQTSNRARSLTRFSSNNRFTTRIPRIPSSAQRETISTSSLFKLINSDNGSRHSSESRSWEDIDHNSGKLIRGHSTPVLRDEYTEQLRRQSEFDKWSQSCFHGVRQKVLLGSAFAVERGLRLIECQCLCARTVIEQSSSTNIGQKRYGDKTCKSIVYNSNQNECILSSETRDSQHKYPFVELATTEDITFHEFLCHQSQLQTRTYVQSVCDYIEHKQTTTPVPLPNLRRSDSCYMEAKEYLLRDSAVAIQSHIPLRQCKCMCAASHETHNSLGFTCMSIMYYYDERVCILNRDTQTQRPELFRQDVTNYAVTYYQFSCANQYESITSYVSHHCNDDQRDEDRPHFPFLRSI